VVLVLKRASPLLVGAVTIKRGGLGLGLDEDGLKETCLEMGLMPYMVPVRIFLFESFPLGITGKVNLEEVRQLMEISFEASTFTEECAAQVEGQALEERLALPGDRSFSRMSLEEDVRKLNSITQSITLSLTLTLTIGGELEIIQ